MVLDRQGVTGERTAIIDEINLEYSRAMNKCILDNAHQRNSRCVPPVPPPACLSVYTPTHRDISTYSTAPNIEAAHNDNDDDDVSRLPPGHQSTLLAAIHPPRYEWTPPKRVAMPPVGCHTCAWYAMPGTLANCVNNCAARSIALRRPCTTSPSRLS
eukprot:2004566-Rhodomonas_salina.6